MNKELKEQAKEYFEATLLDGNKMEDCGECLVRIDEDFIKVFNALIDKTVQQTEERIVGVIKSNSKGSFTDSGGNDCWYIDELVSLITNKSDIKVMEKKDFIKEIEKLCRKYNLSISHEDSHGAFIINEFNESDMEWLKNAQII